MEDDSSPPSERDIIEMFHAGKLTAYIFSYNNFEDKESTLAVFADLHNANKIDILSLTEGAPFESISQNSFFAGQHFFCEIIPKLKGSTHELMRCVSRLVKKAGQDLAANQPNVAFRQWCSVDLGRAQEVVNLARDGDSIASEFLTFALEAAQLFEEAIEILQTNTNAHRLSAMTAISRMKLGDEEIQKALNAFLASLDDEADDVLLANILSSAFALVAASGKQSPLLLKITRWVCERPGPQVHFCCARTIWVHAEILTEELLSPLVHVLRFLDPTHTRTLGELDSGLRNLLATPFVKSGIGLLATLLTTHPKQIRISNFESFGHALVKRDDEFQKVLISWLLSGEKPLCDALSEIFSMSGTDRSIDIASSNLQLEPKSQIFICRKAIGYFFLFPLFASSILISVLRVCSGDVSKVIAALLFDPLLRNYGGKLRECLARTEHDDPAFRFVRLALDDAERYLADLKSVSEIVEISPSESERQAAYRRDADEVRKSHKAAMNQSVLMSLVKRSVILYGKRTLTYVQGPGDQQKLVEMDLKSHSIGWELPRTTIIDPVGLDFMLRVFRNERLPHEAYTS